MSSVPVPNIRNVAIIAHVDHGKTTLVDAMLRQAGALDKRTDDDPDAPRRVMDSMDLERERGITILAKNTAVKWRGPDGNEVKINIVDTPGHADFGGEVERALTMVDGVLLLVDASEGPLPQTRFVLRKTLELRLPVILVVNKIDRPDARIDEVVHEVEELFLDLDADIDQIDFPTVFTNAKVGSATLDLAEPGKTLLPLFETIIGHLPAPETDPDHPLQAQVTNLDASPFVGRLALCRVHHGVLQKGKTVAWCRSDGTVEQAKITLLYGTESHERVEVDQVTPGDIAAVAGIAEITIGETLSDLADPRPLPVIQVDQPNLAMTIGINTSPLAGKEGKKLTARLVKARLDQELVGNVSLAVKPTERPDAWEVHARGELQLAVLVEIMRREGFELTVGKPQVLTREIDGKRHEPIERLTIDIPEEHLGVVTQMLASRKGRMSNMVNHGTGWVRLDYIVPARGLIAFRTEFLTETRGTGVMNHINEGWEPWFGEIRVRSNGSIVADRKGPATPYAIVGLQERAKLFVPPGTEVYTGMVVGENSRAEDMDVNICREKKLTNMRAAASDNTEKLVPPIEMTLDRALEFIGHDECVEVTPLSVRLRKVELDPVLRARATKQAKNG